MYMNIKSNPLILPIIFNLIIIVFLYLDLYMPTNKTVSEKFSTFYNLVDNSPKIKGGGQTVRSFLDCKSGNTYSYVSPIDKDFSFRDNEPIIITKTKFLSKTRTVKSLYKNKEFYVSLISLNSIKLMSIISLLIAIANLFVRNNFFELLLSFSCGYALLISGLYLYYF